VENIAHTLCGIAVAETGFVDRVGKKTAWWTAIVAANAADVDLLTYPVIGHDHYMMWHRGVSHSLLACLVAPPLIALVAHKLSGRSFKLLWVLAFLGYATHLLMDVVTSWGTMLLMPFDDARFSTHWVYIIDIFFWIILSAPFWLTRIVPIDRRFAARFSLGLVAAYVGLCGVLHSVAVDDVEEAAERQGIALTHAAAFPAPFLPVLWNGIGADERFLYQGAIQVVGGAEPQLRPRARNLDHDAVKAALATDYGGRFANWWADIPFAQVRCRGKERYVMVGDLKYVNPWYGRPSFSLVFQVARPDKSSSLKVVKRYWQTPWTDQDVPTADCPTGPKRKRKPKGS